MSNAEENVLLAELDHWQQEKKKPTIGIAFGGGGIRGMAHLGIIEALDREGIRADKVSGTSIGSALSLIHI